MTLGDMIPDVRKLVNDTVVEYRWPDADIVGYLRDAIVRLRVVRQVVSTTTGTLTRRSPSNFRHTSCRTTARAGGRRSFTTRRRAVWRSTPPTR